MGGRYGLIGRTLAHSCSPALHAMLGNADYRLIEIEPGALGDFLQRADFDGLNVTIPYKRAVMPYLHHIDAEAAAIGSVNTIVNTPQGLCGYNTDACGLRFLAARAGISFAGKKTLVFGSGGASLCAQAVAKAADVAEVTVISRGGRDNYENLSRHYDAELLINATPLGMFPHEEGCCADPALFPRLTGVIDLVYNPLRTRLVLAAQNLGIPAAGGLAMLAAQARAAEELFFGKTIDDGTNERVLRALLKERENIVLIGMPGAGKSTVGRALASLTGRRLIDLDELIAARAGEDIPRIFARSGENAFRALESEAARLAGRENGCIITCGGGIVVREENFVLLRANGRIYWLTRDIGALPREGRPLSASADLAEMYRRRAPLYRRFAAVSIENDNTPQSAAERIWRDFIENTGA